MTQEVEAIMAELKVLSRKKPLADKQLNKAKELMKNLKEMGFTNLEIGELTGWGEPTVKLYTRGTKVEDPSPKKEATKLLAAMVDMGLTLGDVQLSTSMKADLDSKGVDLRDLSSLLQDAKRYGIDIRELIKMYVDTKSSELSLSQLREALSYRSQLEEAGFTVDGLRTVSQVSAVLGGYPNVLEALNTYKDLTTIKAELQNKSAEREKLDKQISTLKSDLKKLEDQRKSAENALRLHQELLGLGFDEATLGQLKNSSERYGGVKKVFEALSLHTRISDLEAMYHEFDKANKDWETAVNQLRAEHAHLQEIIKVCDSLLFGYGFSVSAINDLYELAKTHGNPLETLKALGRYGDIRAIESEIAQLVGRKAEFEKRIGEQNTQLQELRGIADELKNTTKGLFKPLADEISRGVSSIQQKFLDSINSISWSYEEYSKRFGDLKSEAGKLEDELGLARAVNAMIKYPSEVKDLPIDYALLLHEAVARFCLAKGVNPKVRAGDELQSKYTGISWYVEAELLDLLGWSKRGLLEALKPTQPGS